MENPLFYEWVSGLFVGFKKKKNPAVGFLWVLEFDLVKQVFVWPAILQTGLEFV